VTRTSSASPLHVAALHVHPVKSCGGFQVDRWPVTPRGLLWDRQWLLVGPDGTFVTQRALPGLARITTTFHEAQLVLQTPGLEPLTVPLDRREGEVREVRIWSDTCLSVDAGDAVAHWLQQAAGTPLRLVRMAPDFQRQVDPAYAPAGATTDFADGFPILVTTMASLDDLNGIVDAPVEMRRFRANVVIAGAQPWAEEGWRRLRIGPVLLDLVKPCVRCSIITVDPDTGVAGKEPLKALGQLRDGGGRVVFGVNALVLEPGEIAVGTAVTLEE
jgi:uncharacterized protein YcbX